jgi:putative peptidoglycan lipid II flippase
VVKVLSPGFFARGDTATPVKVSFGIILLNFALNIALMRPLRHMGPALASSIAASVNVLVLGLILARRGHFALDARASSRLPRMLVAAAAMGVALWGGQRVLFDPLRGHHGLRWAGLAALIALGLAAYGAAGELLGAFDLRASLATTLRRRTTRLRPG